MPSPDDQKKYAAIDYLWLAACTAAGVALRAVHMDARPLWTDELTTLITLRKPFPESLYALQDPQPPLYQAILRLYADIPGHPSEWAMRFPSFVAGCLVIPLAWLLARSVASRPVAALAVLLTAVNPMLIYYSREARPYSLFVCVALASMLMLWRVLRHGKALDMAGLALATALLFYTHYYAVFLVAGQVMFVAADYLMGGLNARRLKLLVGAYALALLGALPGLMLFFRLLKLGMPGAYWIGRPSAITAVEAMGDLLGINSIGPLCLIPLAACLWPRRSPFDTPASGGEPASDWWGRRRIDLLCVMWIACGLILPIVGSILFKPGYVLRYTLPVAIPLIVLGLRYLRAVSIPVMLIIALLLAAAAAPKAREQLKRVDGLRGAAAFLAKPEHRDTPACVMDWPFCDGFINPEVEGLRYYGLTDRPLTLLPVKLLDSDKPEATARAAALLPAGKAYVVCFSSTINPLIGHLQREKRDFTVLPGMGEYINIVELAPARQRNPESQVPNPE